MLPKGKLRNLMLKKYLKQNGTPDAEAFITAQAEAGLVVTGCIYPVLPIQLTLSSRTGYVGYPELTVGYLEESGNNYVKLATSYSASE